jgi:hypothetical protein
VRPAHLGKSTSGSIDWGIQVQFLPPILNYRLENLSPKAKGLVLWLIDGKKLDLQELKYLCILPSQEPKIKILIESAAIAQLQQGTSLSVVKLWLAALLGELSSGLVLEQRGRFYEGAGVEIALQ